MAYPRCMRALPSATIVCRVLIGLERSDASGTLRVRSPSQEAALVLASGHVVAANIDRRVASSPVQVLEGLYRMCAWDAVVLRLFSDAGTADYWRLDQALDARALALQTIRRAVQSMDTSSVRVEVGRRHYRMTPAGEHLVRGLSLRSEEQALLFWLRRGVQAEDVPSLPGCGLAGYRFLCCLKLLRAAAPRGGSYPLLLRKRQQLRQRASAHDLLDLPAEAGSHEARRALRRLVRELHPDRFGADTPPALRRASGEIVTALVAAEARIADRHN